MIEVVDATEVENLGGVLDGFLDDYGNKIGIYTRASLLGGWVKQKIDLTADDLVAKVVPLLGDALPIYKEMLASKFLEKNSATSFADVRDKILPLFPEDYKKRDALSDWMIQPSNILDIDGFINEFWPAVHVSTRLPLTKTWLKHAAKINSQDLKDGIFALPTWDFDKKIEKSLSQVDRREMARIFMDRAENRDLAPEARLADAKILFPEKDVASNLVTDWLAQERNLGFVAWLNSNLDRYQVTLIDLGAITDFIDKYDNEKDLPLEFWAINNAQSIDARSFVEQVRPLAKSDSSRNYLNEIWIRSREVGAVRINELRMILSESSSYSRAGLIRDYWKKTSGDLQNLKEVVAEIAQNKYPYGLEIMELIGDYEERSGAALTLNQLKEIAAFVDDRHQLELANHWINNPENAAEFNNLYIRANDLYLGQPNADSARVVQLAGRVGSRDRDMDRVKIFLATDQDYLTNPSDERNIASDHATKWNELVEALREAVVNKMKDLGQYPVAHLNDDNSISFFAASSPVSQSLHAGFTTDYIVKQLEHQSLERGFQTIAGKRVLEVSDHLDAIEYRINLSPYNLDSILKSNPQYNGYRGSVGILSLTRDFTPDAGVINLFPVITLEEDQFMVQAAGCQLYELPSLQLMRSLPNYESEIAPRHRREGFNFHWNIDEVVAGLGLNRYSIADIFNKIFTENQASEIYHTDQGRDSLTFANDAKTCPIKVVSMSENTKEFYAMYGNCSREELEQCQSLQIDLAVFLQETKRYLDASQAADAVQKSNVEQMIKNLSALDKANLPSVSPHLYDGAHSVVRSQSKDKIPHLS